VDSRVRPLATLLVAGLLGMAAVTKLMQPESFALDIANYKLLPRQALQPLAYLLPPWEAVVALALFSKTYRRAAWLLAGALFLLFAGAVGSAVARGLDISCGCFGGAMTVSWVHLVVNLVLVLLCLWQFRVASLPPRAQGEEPGCTG
jgi:putative oxidoreductase